MDRPKPMLAIMNSNPELIAMFHELFQDQGFKTVAVQIRDLKSGKVDFEEFIIQNDPKVIIYDVAIPYKENWDYFKKIKKSEIMQGRKVVITSTNKKILDELTGEETPAIEVVGKPFDLQEIVDAVRE